MGRITVFTSDDFNSKRVLKALEKRELPYEEINISAHMDKIPHLQSLSGVPSVPLVFFNTRCIGGSEATLKELRKWDRSNRYNSPLDKYNVEVAGGHDPTDGKLALPDAAPTVQKPPTDHDAPASVVLPDGTKTTVLDITEKLKNTLFKTDLKYKGVIYKNSFTGKWAIKTFAQKMRITEQEAIAFGQRLVDAKIVHHVCESKAKTEFKADDKEVYILHCFKTPEVLNSYCEWKEEVTKDCFEILDNLFKRMAMVEAASADDDGMFNCDAATANRNYAVFEHAVCELQKMDMGKMISQDELKAFALNVYNLFQRYAFLKVGAPQCESDRLHFLDSVKFDVGGCLFTFQEWVDGILRPNQKAGKSARAVFGRFDRRRKLGLEEADYRVHFGINMSSHTGSSFSAPFVRFNPESIDEELDTAARVFCADDTNVLVDRKKNRVKLTGNVFEVYALDFGRTDNEVLETIYEYLDPMKKSDLGCMIAKNKGDKGPKLFYQDCRWGKFCRNNVWYHKESIEKGYKGVKNVIKRFQPAKPPKEENARLDTLRNLDILDTLPEERFDRITRMVRDTYKTDYVFISLVDQNRQWFKSTQWCTSSMAKQAEETPRDISFCGHAILVGPEDVFVVENALADDRFADNPLVTGPMGVRFYAGIPLAIPSDDGSGLVNIGALCMVDQKPRGPLTEAELAQFKEYGQMVKTELLRRGSEEGSENNDKDAVVSVQGASTPSLDGTATSADCTDDGRGGTIPEASESRNSCTSGMFTQQVASSGTLHVEI